jgi:hypothetical protein
LSFGGGKLNKKRYLVLALVIMLFSAGFYFWTDIYVHSPVEAMERAYITCGDILHIVPVDDGAVIYYRDINSENEIYTGYVQNQTLTGWKWMNGGGIAEIDKYHDISWCWSELKGRSTGYLEEKTLLGTMFGVVTNPLISSIKIDTAAVEIEEPGIEATANIVECGGIRLWYVVTDKDITHYTKIFGYSSDGVILDIANDWGATIKEEDSPGEYFNYRVSKSLNRTFYAPDEKHYVELNARPEIADFGEIIYDVFLGATGGSKKAVGEQILANPRRGNEYVIWLNERQFLLNGKKVICLDGTKIEMDWGELTYVSSYQVNLNRSKLALIGKDEECSRLVNIIDLNNRHQVITEAKHPYMDTGRTGELCNRLVWDEKGRIYYENDLESPLADGADYVYCLNSGGSNLFSVNSLVLNNSPDYRYIVMLKVTGIDKSETMIYDSREETFLSGTITGQPIWVSPDKFVVLIPDGSLMGNSQVNLYDIQAGKTVVQKTMELPPGHLDSAILNKDYLYFTLNRCRKNGATQYYEAFEVVKKVD